MHVSCCKYYTYYMHILFNQIRYNYTVFCDCHVTELIALNVSAITDAHVAECVNQLCDFYRSYVALGFTVTCCS